MTYYGKVHFLIFKSYHLTINVVKVFEFIFAYSQTNLVYDPTAQYAKKSFKKTLTLCVRNFCLRVIFSEI